MSLFSFFDVVRTVFTGVGSFSLQFLLCCVFPNYQIELLIKKRGGDVFRPVYTGVGSFSLQYLLCMMS